MRSSYPTGLLILLSAPLAFGQAASPFASSVWCGNVTSTSTSVVVRLKSPNQTARLYVSPNPSLASLALSESGTTAAASGNTVTLSAQLLQPDTDYYYGVEIAGVLRTEPESRGRFHTFPVGRSSFKIAFASCSD